MLAVNGGLSVVHEVPWLSSLFFLTHSVLDRVSLDEKIASAASIQV